MLYISLPIALAKEIITNKFDKINQFTDIPLIEFLEAVELTLKSTYFMYNKSSLNKWMVVQWGHQFPA